CPLGDSKLGAVANARLNEALDHIAAHFPDPALGLMKVSENMRISPPLCAAAAGSVRNVLYRTSERAAPATRLHVADRSAREQEPHLRRRTTGRLFRCFPLQPAIPFPLRRYPKGCLRTQGQYACGGRSKDLIKRPERSRFPPRGLPYQLLLLSCTT